MINIHKVTDLNIERSEDWTCLEVVTNEMTRHHYELARLIAKDYDNIDSFDIAVIIQEYFSKETDTIEITLFHKDNKSVDIKITERDDA
jgi:hypothetical protein|tara:strand:- start:4937 stop:5203 length:267 start_codon:yes stop_codon:yes gene_type:complete